MRVIDRCIAWARQWFDETTVSNVFEPLVADWQHELATARHQGGLRYAAVFIAGALAYLRTVAGCTMSTGGWLPTPRAAQTAAITLFITLDAALLVLWMVGLPTGRTAEPSSIQTQTFVLFNAGLAVAPALLPVLFLMRRYTATTAKHAVTAIAVGAVLVAGVVALTSDQAVRGYFSSFESFERQYQRNVANDRDGRTTYPGTAVREQREPTTIEQRRADYERYRTWAAFRQAQEPPPTWQGQIRRMQPVALAILFGIMGWTLARLGPVSVTRAAMWWALMYVALLVFSGPRILTGTALPMLPRGYGLALFGAATLALVIASWRKPRHDMHLPSGTKASGTHP